MGVLFFSNSTCSSSLDSIETISFVDNDELQRRHRSGSRSYKLFCYRPIVVIAENVLLTLPASWLSVLLYLHILWWSSANIFLATVTGEVHFDTAHRKIAAIWDERFSRLGKSPDLRLQLTAAYIADLWNALKEESREQERKWDGRRKFYVIHILVYSCVGIIKSINHIVEFNIIRKVSRDKRTEIKKRRGQVWKINCIIKALIHIIRKIFTSF